MNRLINQEITEKKLKSRYEALIKKTPSEAEVHARHILVASDGEARELIRILKAGQNFDEVAKKHSRDSTASRGGDLGFFRAKDMVKPFSDAAFAMKPGEISEVPVKTEFGWHIIKIENI